MKNIFHHRILYAQKSLETYYDSDNKIFVQIFVIIANFRTTE
jgi:hypothetical protein